MGSGDNFKFRFPKEFELEDNGVITATCQSISLKPYIFEDLYYIYFEVVDPIAASGSANLVISNLRNQKYASLNAYSITLDIYRNDGA